MPFCEKHNLRSRAVHFATTSVLPKTDDDWRLKLKIAHRWYGIHFAEANHLAGRWADRRTLLKRFGVALSGLALMLLAVPLVILSGTAMSQHAADHSCLSLLASSLVWAAGIGLGYAGWWLFNEGKPER